MTSIPQKDRLTKSDRNANEVNEGEPATHPPDIFSRQHSWYEAGLNRHLDALRALPRECNVNKPGSPFWLHLRAIAGISKAGHVSKMGAFERVRWAIRHMRVSAREARYQWERAYLSAHPWRGPNTR